MSARNDVVVDLQLRPARLDLGVDGDHRAEQRERLVDQVRAEVEQHAARLVGPGLLAARAGATRRAASARSATRTRITSPSSPASSSARSGQEVAVPAAVVERHDGHAGGARGVGEALGALAMVGATGLSMTTGSPAASAASPSGTCARLWAATTTTSCRSAVAQSSSTAGTISTPGWRARAACRPLGVRRHDRRQAQARRGGDHRRVEGRARQPVADQRHSQVVHHDRTLPRDLRCRPEQRALGRGPRLCPHRLGGAPELGRGARDVVVLRRHVDDLAAEQPELDGDRLTVDVAPSGARGRAPSGSPGRCGRRASCCGAPSPRRRAARARAARPRSARRRAAPSSSAPA